MSKVFRSVCRNEFTKDLNRNIDHPIIHEMENEGYTFRGYSEEDPNSLKVILMFTKNEDFEKSEELDYFLEKEPYKPHFPIRKKKKIRKPTKRELLKLQRQINREKKIKELNRIKQRKIKYRLKKKLKKQLKEKNKVSPFKRNMLFKGF